MAERIAFVKTGWSEEYAGGPVIGRHSHIKKFSEAHEALNFLPDMSGTYYAYVPPIGEQFRPPQPSLSNGWLVVFVSAKDGNGPLTVVGWYKDASFLSEYKPRPDYGRGHLVPRTPSGEPYIYCLSAPSGHLVDPEHRTVQISGVHFRRAPIIYVKGGGRDDEWRKELAALTEKLVAVGPQPINSAWKPKIVFPDAEHRRKVEEAAVEFVKKHLKQKGYAVEDKQALNCGYDLLAEKGKGQLHVEVKGTASEVDHFFISRNEWLYSSHPLWRLAIVSNALEKPTLSMLTKAQLEQKFVLDALAYHAQKKEA